MARYDITSGVTSTGKTLNNDSMYVYSGGTANSTTVNSYGRIYISSGGIANNTAVNNWGDMGVSFGGAANYATVNFEGYLLVFSGGIANSTTVNSGGSMRVSSGGTATNIVWTPCEGRVVIRDGGYATFVSQYSGVYYGSENKLLSNAAVMPDQTVGIFGTVYVMSGGTANSTTLSGGWLDIHSGGMTNSTTINSGGGMDVSSGGTANTTTVNDGFLDVSSGGTASNTTISSGGYMRVFSGGTANNTTVFGGYMCVSSDGTANNTTVNSQGYFYVYDGGTANSATVKDWGNMYVFSGGKLTGQMIFVENAVVSVEEGAILDFDISELTADAGARVNNLSIIQGMPLYTLTVSGTQLEGTYKLAAGAEGFDRTISVVNTGGTSLGALTVGQTVNIGGTGYTLNLDGDGLLSVSVGAVAPTSKPAKFDVDGNGVSDVMFVWTGYNYAHGYWMNGDANDWRSTYAVHPAEWENLGCYDMNGDGKADSVLVGNITLEAGKGAYIGYYLNGEDTDANWVNIDFLNNAAGVVWKNKVGNLTGNENANSIIWYAPDMYTLGAWTDGTSSWALLNGNFGGEFWQMVGCGDFDGDGKDSVLMSGGNGQMLYSVGIDGVATSHGSADWSGWDVRAIGDFAGDGKDDIVLFHSTLGAMALLVDGNADNYVSLGQLNVKDWFVVGAGDYNGDQKDDLLVRQKSTGMLGYYNACDTSETGWVEMGRGVDLNWTVIA